MPGKNRRAVELLVCSLIAGLLAACSSPSIQRSGGYYKDDGPGDHTPSGLLNVPDAQPRAEPFLPRANRPYSVFGKTYVPITDNRPYKQQGIGSWYGKKFHGNKTSSGELYDMYKMTAAHPILPIPSYARVTNLDNGKHVIVRINDRGPFHSGRLIDLSYTAALKLDYIGKGSGKVEVERVFVGEPAPARVADPRPAAPAPRQSGSSGGYYVQVGAFSQRDNAEALRRRYALEGNAVDVVQSGGHYRLMAGPFSTKENALLVADKLPRLGVKPIVVQR